MSTDRSDGIQWERVQKSVEQQTRENLGSDDLLKIATVLKYQAEARKAESELKSLPKPGWDERTRLYLPILASSISSLVAVLALAFQSYQFRLTFQIQQQTADIQRQASVDTAQIQRQTAEDTQWREVTKTLASSTTGPGAATGFAMLQPFLDQGSHKSEARTVAEFLLPNVINFDGFKRLFETVLRATPEPDQASFVTNLSKNLRERYSAAETALQDLKPAPPPDAPTIQGARGPIDNPAWMLKQFDREIGLLSSVLPSILAATHGSVNLSDAALWDGNYDNLLFPSSDISRASLAASSFSGSDLTRISKFDGSFWSASDWWHARAISPELLSYLKTNFPFDRRATYKTPQTIVDYQNNLARLEGRH